MVGKMRKTSSLITSPHSYRQWYCPWLPADHDHIHEAQSDYQRQIVRLMFAALVLYGSSAIHLLPDDCQTSLRFIPASRALSLAGLLTQLAFHRGIPPHIPDAFSLIRTGENRPRAVLFFASMWLPFVPFVLSIILFCFGNKPGACIPSLNAS